MQTPNVITQQRALNHVLGIFNSVRSEHITRISRFDRWSKLYHSESDRKIYRGRADVFIPSTFEAVETIVPRLVEAILGVDPPFAMVGREYNDEQQAKIIQALMTYQLQQMGFAMNFLDFVRPLVVYGTGIAKIFWRYNVKTLTVKEKTIFGFPTRRKRDIVLYDNPVFQPIDPYDFFIDPQATTIEDADWVIQRAIVNHKSLNPNIYFNLDKIRDEDFNIIEILQEKLTRRMVENQTIDTSKRATKKVEVLEYWGPFDLKDDGKEEECVIVIANKKVVVRLEENPYLMQEKPFVACPYIRTPDRSFWGISLPSICEDMNLELNAKRNQALDYITFQLDNMWLRDRNAGIDKKNLKAIPGGIIDCDDINGLMPLRPIAGLGEFFTMEAIIKEDIRRATKATTTLQGMPAGARTTATEIASMVQEANTGIRLHIRILEEMVLKPFLLKIYSYNQQFIDKARVVRVAGEQEGKQFIRVLPEDIVGNYDVIPQVAFSLENKEIKRRQFLEIYPILAQNPNIDQIKLLRRLLELFEFKGIEELFIPAVEAGMMAEGITPAPIPAPTRTEMGGAPMPPLGAEFAGTLRG